ncbi:Piso0_001414 [Millerozyma farinosa CBS 7064]|uniref:Piso0_001414 protein n=1 Tax=Pichia sorbitophila (strain ATCC MYA-4447 / BCRC 22081 / CBS 7064 / NBRC 10061 / NRRL Y-12695) TaxID=559304 RepID=G8YKQ8_PICSO|nr:Piso0_001414 [Millerozyma farinosa CBS 7064]
MEVADKDGFEEFLSKDSFYSGPSGSRNHIDNLRKSISIPYSISSQSINAQIAPEDTRAGPQRTSFMKNSPSIKALENILTSKNEFAKSQAPEIIDEADEEEEEGPSTPLNGRFQRDNIQRIPEPQVAPMIAVHSQNSEETFRTHTPDNTNRNRGFSLSTTEEGYSFNTESPELLSPAQIQTLRHVKGNDPAGLNHVKLINENTEDSDEQVTKVSNHSLDNEHDEMEQEDTLFENENDAKAQMLQNKPLSNRSMIPSYIWEENTPSAPMQQGPTNEPKVSSVKEERNTSKPLPPTQHAHQRSGSVFSTISKFKEQPALPKQEKTAPQQESKKTKSKGKENTGGGKKFSFRNLFGLKSKKKTDDDLVSVPAKIKSRSYSSPDILTTSKKPNTASDRRSIFGGRKQDKNYKPAPVRDTKQGDAYETQHEVKKPDYSRQNAKPPSSAPTMTRSLTSPDIFSASDNARFTSDKENSNLDEQLPARASQQVNHAPTRTPYQVNSIREVDDDAPRNISLIVPEGYSPLGYVGLSNEKAATDAIDDSNIGQQSFEPQGEYLEKEIFTEDDGRQPQEAEEATHTLQNHSQEINNSLLGEALFPRSLSQREVNSIVSLERSRSMKSIKDTKRSSFVNYSGNDDNIVHFEGPPADPANSSISRSNSILKNTGNAQEAQSPGDEKKEDGDENEDENLQDFIEFSDFIDLDNLDFSLSPRRIVGSSPIVEPNHSGQRSPISSNLASAARIEALTNAVPGTSESDPIVIDDSYGHTSTDVTDSQRDSSLLPSSLSPTSEDDDVRKQVTDRESEEMRTENEKTHISITDSSSEAIHNTSGDQSNSLLTPNLQTIDPTKFATSPETIESPESDHQPDYSQMAAQNSMYSNRPVKSRPISMSFKGLKGPSFGAKLNAANLRNSESHQSFNLSLSENETDDMENSEVGAGFGTSDDDSDDFEDPDDEAYNLGLQSLKDRNRMASRNVSEPRSHYSPSLNQGINGQMTDPIGSGDSRMSYAQPPSFSNFVHNKIPSISSHSSSPRSFSSMFSRRLKFSPNVSGNPKVNSPVIDTGGVRFSSRIILYDTYNGDEYDRHPDIATCNQLTPSLAQSIRDELNSFKSEWEVHDDSRCNTHFL